MTIFRPANGDLGRDDPLRKARAASRACIRHEAETHECLSVPLPSLGDHASGNSSEQALTSMSAMDQPDNVRSIELPGESQRAHLFPTTDMVDAFAISLPTGTPPDIDGLARAILAHSAPWFVVLLKIRDVAMTGMARRNRAETIDLFNGVLGRRSSLSSARTTNIWIFGLPCSFAPAATTHMTKSSWPPLFTAIICWERSIFASSHRFTGSSYAAT